MNDLGWRADGINRAVAAGGVPLERYRRPGFTGGPGVRRADMDAGGGGFEINFGPRFEADIEIIGRDPLPPAARP